MRQAKKFGALGVALALVVALGMLATGAGRAGAQTPFFTCTPGNTLVTPPTTESCTFTTLTTVATGGTLTLTAQTPGVTITGISPVGGVALCAPAVFSGGGTTVTVGPCPAGSTIPAGQQINIALGNNPGGGQVTVLATYNGGAPVGPPPPPTTTAGGACQPSPIAAAGSVTCTNFTGAAVFAGSRITVTFNGSAGSTLTMPPFLGGTLFANGPPFGLPTSIPCGDGSANAGVPDTGAGTAATTRTILCYGPAPTGQGITGVIAVGAGFPATVTETTVTNAVGTTGIPIAPTTQTLIFGGLISVGSAATKSCQASTATGGGGGPGSIGNTCAVTVQTNAIPAGGSLVVTLTNTGWTVTACTGQNGTTGTVLGTNACVFANPVGAVPLLPGNIVGIETFSIPTGAPVGTLITQTAQDCANVVTATVTCTALGGFAPTNVVVTGPLTAVLAAAAAVGGAAQPVAVVQTLHTGSITGPVVSETQPDELSAVADRAGSAPAVDQSAPLLAILFVANAVQCRTGGPGTPVVTAPAVPLAPPAGFGGFGTGCADGTFAVKIVSPAVLAATTGILGCDGAASLPAAAAPCQVLNNGNEVDVNCGQTAGAIVPVGAGAVAGTPGGISNTCGVFNFTLQSNLGACVANPIAVPIGGCPNGGLTPGPVTLQITFLATPGNGGVVGGVNILPSATINFAAPAISALLVSASPFAIPSNGTLASVVTATFSCAGTALNAATNGLTAPGTSITTIAGLFAAGLGVSALCNPGLPGTFNFNALGPVIFDNGRQQESVSCGPSAALSPFGVGAIGIPTFNQLTPLTFTCTGAAVLAIGAGAAGDAPINVTFQSAVGGFNAVGAALITVVPSGAPVIGIACNPSIVAAGGLGSICVATVTDINRVPLSGLTGATVTFTVSDQTQATIIPCLVNIPSATINVTTSPNIIPQLLPGGPCATPSSSIPGQVNTFVNGQAAAVLVASPTAHPGPVTVTASLGVLIPPEFSCIVSPFTTGITGVASPLFQNTPSVGLPGLTGCGASAPFGTSGLVTGLSQASLGFTGLVTMPNATSASTVVNIGGQFGILIAGSSPLSPLILSRGCNQMIVTAASGTPVSNIAGLVSPQAAVVSMWRFNNGTKQFQAGFFSDPAAPTDFVTFGATTTANIGNLPAGTVTTPIVGGGNAVVTTGAQLTETYFICVNQSATIASG